MIYFIDVVLINADCLNPEPSVIWLGAELLQGILRILRDDEWLAIDKNRTSAIFLAPYV
jgi:hypothetical protein